MTLGVAGLLLGPPSLAAAEPLPSPAQPPDAIVGGVLTEAGELDAVVALHNSADKVCSGTLVTPRLVLTAAHCLDEHRADQPLRVFFGNDTSGQFMDAERFGAHPQFCRACEEEAHDYAYVELPEDYVPRDGVLLPLVSQDEWDETMIVGGVVLLAGFGNDDPFADGIQVERKRKVSVTIKRFTDQGLEFYAGGDQRDTCPGDSGGPAIVQLGNGERRLAGITSRGSDPCGLGGFYGIPYAALAWVATQTGTSLLPPGCETRPCLDTTPPPVEGEGCTVGTRPRSGSWWMLALLGAAAVRLRGRGRGREPERRRGLRA